MTVNPTEFSVVVRGLKLSGLSWGSNDLPPVVSMHGWLDNAQSFALLAPLIKGRRIIALDLPGHGLSDHRLEGMPHYISEYAIDVLHVIAQLGGGPVDMMGHSMGAGVASCVAGGMPKAINKLILLDGIGPWAGDEASTASRMKVGFEQYLHVPKQLGNYASVDELIARRKIATAYLADDCVERIVRRNAIKQEKGWAWRTDPRLKHNSLMMYTEAEVENIIAHIDCPVLHITATEGIISKVPFRQTRLAQVKNLVDVELAGHHHFHMDGAVEAIAHQINRFLLD